MKERNKKIFGAVIVFLLIWVGGIVIHELFLNLEYGVLRSFIVGVGVAIWRYKSNRF